MGFETPAGAAAFHFESFRDPFTRAERAEGWESLWFREAILKFLSAFQEGIHNVVGCLVYSTAKGTLRTTKPWIPSEWRPPGSKQILHLRGHVQSCDGGKKRNMIKLKIPVCIVFSSKKDDKQIVARSYHLMVKAVG